MMITNILRVLLTRSFETLKFTGGADYEMKVDKDEAGIYVHIPFCTTLCSFCPYNRYIYEKSAAKAYKEALIKEIDMVGSLNHDVKIITSVYFGGGTPELMLDELGEIIASLKKNFNIKGSMGIELHPRDIDQGTLHKLRDLGFDMVSIGIQSFNRECLNALGREYIDGANKVRLAKEAGFRTIDVDLIFGISNQSAESLRDDFLTAFQCGATQVSTYPFIDFSYANNKRKPLGRYKKKRLLESLENVGREIECERTSVWTFGKRGIPKYSSVTRDIYMGFGAGAASLTRNFFKVNTFPVGEYIKCVNKGSIPTAMTMKFNLRNRALYWLFWNSYTLKLDSLEFSKLFGAQLKDLFKMELKAAEMLGILKKEDYGYSLTKNGAYLYHNIEQRYTNEYIDKVWRIARENPWPDEIRLY